MRITQYAINLESISNIKIFYFIVELVVYLTSYLSMLYACSVTYKS